LVEGEEVRVDTGPPTQDVSAIPVTLQSAQTNPEADRRDFRLTNFTTALRSCRPEVQTNRPEPFAAFSWVSILD
jgi:hypothetical protein